MAANDDKPISTVVVLFGVHAAHSLPPSPHIAHYY